MPVLEPRLPDKVRITRALITLHLPINAGEAAALLASIAEVHFDAVVRPQFAGEDAGFTVMITELVDADDPRADRFAPVLRTDDSIGHAEGPDMWLGHNHPPTRGCDEHCPLREA